MRISHQSTVGLRTERVKLDHFPGSTRVARKLVVSRANSQKQKSCPQRIRSFGECLARPDRHFNKFLASFLMMSSNVLLVLAEPDFLANDNVQTLQASSGVLVSESIPTTEVCISSIINMCVPSAELTSFEDKLAAVHSQGNSVGFFLAAVFFSCFFQNLNRIGTDSIFGNSVKAKPYSSKVTSAKTFNFPKRIFSKRKWGGNGDSELNLLARPIDFKMTYNREGKLNVNTVKFNKKRWGGNTPNWSSPELDLSKVTNTGAIDIQKPQFKRRIWGGDGLMYKGIAKYNSPDMDFKATTLKAFLFKRPRFIRKAYGGDDIFPHLSGIKYDKSAVQSQSSEREFLVKKSSGYMVTKPSKISRTNKFEETETQLELNGDPHTDSAEKDTGKSTALGSGREEIRLASDDGSLNE
jgi:hypothetical protein